MMVSTVSKVLCVLFVPVLVAASWAALAVRPTVPLLDAQGRATAVLVTGASSGIGLSAALHLQRQGLHIFAGFRKDADRERLSELGLDPIQLDVPSTSDIAMADARIKDSGLSLVALVNNAGLTTKRPLETVAMASVRRILDVNVFASLELTQQMLPLLRSTARKIVGKSQQRGARIVFIGSVSGIVTLKLNGVYSMSKYALESMADTFRRELATTGIGVSMVNPGYINTNFRKRGAASIQAETLSDRDQALYGADFEKLSRKIARRPTFAAPCCDGTDTAIADAILSPRPRTRYYPAVAMPHVPAWAVAPVLRLFSVVPFTEPVVDWLLAKV